jgi:hypothetical protein
VGGFSQKLRGKTLKPLAPKAVIFPINCQYKNTLYLHNYNVFLIYLNIFRRFFLRQKIKKVDRRRKFIRADFFRF